MKRAAVDALSAIRAPAGGQICGCSGVPQATIGQYIQEIRSSNLMKKIDDSLKSKRAKGVSQGEPKALTRRDAETVAAALLDPPKANAALTRAFRNLRALIRRL